MYLLFWFMFVVSIPKFLTFDAIQLFLCQLNNTWTFFRTLNDKLHKLFSNLGFIFLYWLVGKRWNSLYIFGKWWIDYLPFKFRSFRWTQLINDQKSRPVSFVLKRTLLIYKLIWLIDWLKIYMTSKYITFKL